MNTINAATQRAVTMWWRKRVRLDAALLQEAECAGWDREFNEHQNPNAENLAHGDDGDVLRHMTYIGGLCLRQEIRGPISQKLLSTIPHQNVPEFSAFWSSTPVTASLSKRSVKLLLLFLSIGLTYMAEPKRLVLYVLKGNKFIDDPYQSMQHLMVLNISTDPRDLALRARHPFRLAKVGVILEDSSSLPFGFVEHLVSNYTIVGDNHHHVQYSMPIDLNARYYELEGRHPTKKHYWAWMWLADAFISSQDENTGYTAAFRKLEARYRAMTYEEQLEIDNKIQTYNIEGVNLQLIVYRAFKRIERGWDGKERTVMRNNVSTRQAISIFIYTFLAISAWCALLCSLKGNKEAAKKSMVVLIGLYALAWLVLIIFDIQTLSESEGADSWETVAFAVDNNLCCQKYPDVELDTPAGSLARKQMFVEGMCILTCRALQVLASPGLMWSVWEERQVLLNMLIFFGIIFCYQCIVLPIVAPQAFGYGPLLVSAFGVFFPLFVWWRLASIHKSVSAMIKKDMDAWERLYLEIKARPTAQMQLDRIKRLCMQHDKKEVQQMATMDEDPVPELQASWHQSCVGEAWEHIAQHSLVFRQGQESVVVRNGRVCKPVRNIDQLYLQAKTMVPYLSRLVQIWASASDGMFLVDRGGGGRGALEKWRPIAGNVAGGRFDGKISFAKLKLIPRILEKTQRCYRGDPSRLADLCRAAISFESLEDLADCIELLLNDERIAVDRIKNRLDPNYDVHATQGYRDVNVNFRVLKSPLASQSEEDWLKLGLSEHICEIQLVPMEYFQRSKIGEAHKNYIRYRNLRAE